LAKIRIEIPEFITHVAKTSNKVVANKYIKINNQSIYNGALNKFSRAIAIDNMHKYIDLYLIKYRGLNLLKTLHISYQIHTVINHGSISLRKGKICYKPVKINYNPNWDIENLASIWIKAFNDSLTKNNVISDDNISVITKVSYEFIEVKDIDKRKIVVEIDY